MMKAKLYSQLEFLTCSEAMEYASALLNTALNPSLFERLVLPYIDCYLDFNNAALYGYTYIGEDYESELRVKPSNDTPHKITDVKVCVSDYGAYIAESYQEYLYLNGECQLLNQAKQSSTLGMIEWVLEECEASELLYFQQFIEYKAPDEGMPFIVFNTKNIESFAAKINDEPDYQSLKEENQLLHQQVSDLDAEKEWFYSKVVSFSGLQERFSELAEQYDLCATSLEGADEETKEAYKEIDRLKAEVDRLQTENAELKADDEMNPRKEETLYKLIMGMAIRGYRYDPNAPKNSTVPEIQSDLDVLGIGLGERTIRNHLNAAKTYLPAKPIKT